MKLPDKFESIWTSTTPDTSFPALEQELTVDVAIIGGGIAGINAGYFLKQTGLNVAIIEANKIAAGTSGNTTAKVTSLHELRYAYLTNTFGKNNAQVYADSNQWAIGKLENIIKKENINCDFYHASAFTYTRKKTGLNRIEGEVEAAKELNLPVSFVSSAPSVPFEILGAIKFDNQAYFHPRKYLLTVANLINKDGSYIFEKTRALGIEENSNFCKIRTNRKALKAKFVIIATNFPFYDPAGAFSKVSKTGSYAIAAKAAQMPDGMFLGTQSQDLSFRPHKDGVDEWLIIGSKHRSIDDIGDIDKRFDELAAAATGAFKISGIDFKWGAQDTMSLDLVPYIGKMPSSKKVFVETGFSTWGMTTSIFAAQLLTDLILERSNIWKDLYNPARLRR